MKAAVFKGFVIGTASAILLSGPSGALELITNGGFETGDFTGWTISDQPGGNVTFFIDNNDNSTPFSGQTTVGPATGAFYAVSDQSGPGAHALTQLFAVPSVPGNITLSFDMFVNDWSGQGPRCEPRRA